MTDSTATPAPKKSNKTFFVIIALILGLLGVDHYKFHILSGVDATVTDSTIVVAPAVDTAKAVPSASIDTIKRDSTNK